LVGVRFDPHGALSPFRDPIGRLASRIEGIRDEEEVARKMYVGITRARRSVTLGLPGEDARGISSSQRRMRQAWLKEPLEGVSIHTASPGDFYAARGLSGWGRPTPEEPVAFSTAQCWRESAPSQVRGSAQEAAALERQIVGNGGLHLGGLPLEPPRREVAGHDWGTLVHIWMATWRFVSDPSLQLAQQTVHTCWGHRDDEVAAWLLRISDSLARRGGWLWELVTAPEARLAFEWPVTGVHGDLYLSGRADLLVWSGGEVTVVDFKAGEKCPTSPEDLADQASLTSYGPQLSAYRDLLEQAGFQVHVVCLWFVRTGATVRW
jgi:ATP-dependent exoDNAse (exonuclease V) beta subunit